MLLEKGYRVKEVGGDPYKVYKDVFDSTTHNLPGEVWTRYILLKMLIKLGVDPDEELVDEINEFYIKERAKHFTPQPGLEMFLKTLIAKGYSLVLTTAITSHNIAKGALENNGLLKYFKLIFSTQMVGLKKSDPRFYHQLIEVLNAEPYRVVHIGDDLNSDIEPARIEGLKTIYYGWRTKCRAVDPQPCVLDLMETVHYLPP